MLNKLTIKFLLISKCINGNIYKVKSLFNIMKKEFVIGILFLMILSIGFGSAKEIASFNVGSDSYFYYELLNENLLLVYDEPSFFLFNLSDGSKEEIQLPNNNAIDMPIPNIPFIDGNIRVTENYILFAERVRRVGEDYDKINSRFLFYNINNRDIEFFVDEDDFLEELGNSSGGQFFVGQDLKLYYVIHYDDFPFPEYPINYEEYEIFSFDFNRRELDYLFSFSQNIPIERILDISNKGVYFFTCEQTNLDLPLDQRETEIKTFFYNSSSNEFTFLLNGESKKHNDLILSSFINDGKISSFLLYNLSNKQIKEIQIPEAEIYEWTFFDDEIIWSDQRRGFKIFNVSLDSEIYLYSLETGEEKRITSHSGTKLTPRINGNTVVWQNFGGMLNQLIGNIFPNSFSFRLEYERLN